MASDAFFPFADGLESLTSAGVTSVVQPGGSVRDKSHRRRNAAGIVMMLTGERHFVTKEKDMTAQLLDGDA